MEVSSSEPKKCLWGSYGTFSGCVRSRVRFLFPALRDALKMWTTFCVQNIPHCRVYEMNHRTSRRKEPPHGRDHLVCNSYVHTESAGARHNFGVVHQCIKQRILRNRSEVFDCLGDQSRTMTLRGAPLPETSLFTAPRRI